MPRIADITYSREATVSAVRGYYHFLAQLYLPPSAIIEPPEGGWPNITQENLGHLGKTDEVIDLLRHLPYIHDPFWQHSSQAAPGTNFADWTTLATSSVRSQDVRLATEGDDWEEMPAHVVGLALEARWSFNFNLDTKLGVIHWLKCPKAIVNDPAIEPILDRPEEYVDEEEEPWRFDGGVWEIADLFKQLKIEFERLNFVPQNTKEVVDDYYAHEGEPPDESTEAIREVFRAHGWPDLQTYRKDDCLKALREMLSEKWPDLVSNDEGDE